MMKKMNDNLSNIYIDVDDTITPDFGETIFPNVKEKIIHLSEKTNIIIWSQGGMPYAKKVLKKHKLIKYVCMICPKPDLIIDDLDVNEFCGTKKIINGNWDFEIELDGDWIEDSDVLRQIKE